MVCERTTNIIRPFASASVGVDLCFFAFSSRGVVLVPRSAATSTYFSYQVVTHHRRYSRLPRGPIATLENLGWLVTSSVCWVIVGRGYFEENTPRGWIYHICGITRTQERKVGRKSGGLNPIATYNNQRQQPRGGRSKRLLCGPADRSEAETR